MPAKSKAQAGKMHVLYEQGKITKEQLDKFVAHLDYSALPEHVREKRATK
jgi:hypothetical protein